MGAKVAVLMYVLPFVMQNGARGWEKKVLEISICTLVLGTYKCWGDLPTSLVIFKVLCESLQNYLEVSLPTSASTYF